MRALAGQQLRFELAGLLVTGQFPKNLLFVGTPLLAGTAPASGHRHRQWRVNFAITKLLSGTIVAGFLYDFMHKQHSAYKHG
jgi:hypothetical protein